MFKCGAKCCENTSGSVEEVQRCIERCAEPLTKCQTHIQNEMQQFQVLYFSHFSLPSSIMFILFQNWMKCDNFNINQSTSC